MNALRIATILQTAAGAPGLDYGRISSIKNSRKAKIGSIELSVKERDTVNVRVWAALPAIVIGHLVQVFGSRRGPSARSA